MTARRICIITSARSEYGAAKWLMKAIQEEPALKLQIVVTGSHLAEAFGDTYREIERDGFAIDEMIDVKMAGSGAVALSEAMGVCLSGMGRAFEKLAPQMIVVLGDRYELLPICTAATLAGIPLAHVSGGDLTEGAMDDAIRHAVTKLSHLHFPANEAAAEIIRQLGERSERIFSVGELSLEAFFRSDAISRAELGRMFGLDPSRKWILLAYHPVTLATQADWLPPLENVLTVLRGVSEAQVMMTYPNADPGNEAIRALLHREHERDPETFKLEKSLGHRPFVSFLKEAYGMVGNSSSALLEAPSAKLPAINIGDRQKGRIRGANVIDAAGDLPSIVKAFETMASPAFRNSLSEMVNPYGDGTTAKRIVEVLHTVELEDLRRKPFVQRPAG